MLLNGILGILAVLSLLLFFLGLFQILSVFSFMGSLNDTINAAAGLCSAILAWMLHPTLRKTAPRLSLFLLFGVWAGAIAIAYGAWLIVTGRSDVELSSYYYFWGNSLIGLWLWRVNGTAHQLQAWPRHLTRWGMIAGIVMMIGLLGLYGVLAGLDGNEYSPLMMISGLSYLGIGVLYPIWSLRLGRWIFEQLRKYSRASHTYIPP